MNEKICEYFEPHGGYPLDDPMRFRVKEGIDWKYKKTFRNCPKCKRKLQCWAVVDEDGYIVDYNIPRHKRKKWWKKKNAK